MEKQLYLEMINQPTDIFLINLKYHSENMLEKIHSIYSVQWQIRRARETT